MGVKADQDRVRTLLKDTITLLCKNGLAFDTKFCIDAVIGVTIDEEDVFLVSMNEVIQSEKAQEAKAEAARREAASRKRRSSADSSTREGASGGKRAAVKLEIAEDPGGGETDSKAMLWPGSVGEDNRQQVGAKPPSASPRAPPAASQAHRTPRRAPRTPPTPADQDDGSNDIVFIKEEAEDSWASCSYQDSTASSFQDSYQDPSGGPQPGTSSSAQFDQSLASLAGGSLVPLGAQEASAMWSAVGNPSAPAPHPAARSAQDPSQQMPRGPLYHCHICPKICKTKSGLAIHVGLHAGKYAYHCKECDKGFTSSSALKGHMSWHTGVKEFVCPVCGKDFRYKCDMKNHIASRHPYSS